MSNSPLPNLISGFFIASDMALIPNSTQVPNVILDEWMKELSDTEFRIVMIITRQTFGWIEDTLTGKRKEKDWISYTQLIEKSGRSREAVSDALKSLRQKEYIQVLNSRGETLTGERLSGRRELYYRINTSKRKGGSNPHFLESKIPEKSENLTFKSQKSRPTKETSTKGINTNVLINKFFPVKASEKPGNTPLKAATSYSKKTSYSKETYSMLISYLGGKLGVKFPNYQKQVVNIKRLLDDGNSPTQIRQMIDGMLKDSFWGQRVFDFANVWSHGHKFVKRTLSPEQEEEELFATILGYMMINDPKKEELKAKLTPEQRVRFEKYSWKKSMGIDI